METLLENISIYEQKWLIPLYNYCKTLFNNTHLPSHDAEHHLRVWLNCRELIIELNKAGINIDPSTIEETLIASFFHDTGLTIDVGEQHGYYSRKICEEFFTMNPSLKIPNISEVLDAIEKHDDKSKKELTSTFENMKSVLRLISVADDLDALGFIGIFRYIEIYLKRGVPDNEIPQKVILNLRNRFSNFLNTYSSLHKFSDKQKIRYKETVDFFSELDALFQQNTTLKDCELGVFYALKECLIEKNVGITETIEYVIKTSTKRCDLMFFSKLRNELEVTSSLLLK